MKTKRKTWQFLWINRDDPIFVVNERVFSERVYVADTLEKACDKMLKWIESRSFNVEIDYEARAEHVRYDATKHEDAFPNLNDLDHPINEYIY